MRVERLRGGRRDVGRGRQRAAHLLGRERRNLRQQGGRMSSHADYAALRVATAVGVEVPRLGDRSDEQHRDATPRGEQGEHPETAVLGEQQHSFRLDAVGPESPPDGTSFFNRKWGGKAILAPAADRPGVSDGSLPGAAKGASFEVSE